MYKPHSHDEYVKSHLDDFEGDSIVLIAMNCDYSLYYLADRAIDAMEGDNDWLVETIKRFFDSLDRSQTRHASPMVINEIEEFFATVVEAYLKKCDPGKNGRT